MTRKVRLLLVWPLLAAIALGCGKGSPQAPAKVSGSIKYKNAPVTGGTITFYAKAGGVYNATISPEGTYTIGDLPVGDMEVSVETESINPKKKKPEYTGGTGGPKFGPRPSFKDKPAQASPAPEGITPVGSVGTYVRIPPKYADHKQSGLTATLSAGSNTKDFDLVD
jgi:hypothetical protein